LVYAVVLLIAVVCLRIVGRHGLLCALLQLRLAAAKRPPPRLQRVPCRRQAPSTCALQQAPRPPPSPCLSPRAVNLRLAGRRAPSTCALPPALRPPPAPCLQPRTLHAHANVRLDARCRASASPSDLSKLKFKSTQCARLPVPRNMRPALLLFLDHFYTSTLHLPLTLLAAPGAQFLISSNHEESQRLRRGQSRRRGRGGRGGQLGRCRRRRLP
jgi:hypothetical protein